MRHCFAVLAGKISAVASLSQPHRFGLQPHAEALVNAVLHVFRQTAYVFGTGAAEVNQHQGLFLVYGGMAFAVAFEPALVDKPACD